MGKQSFGAHPGTQTSLCQSQNRRNVLEPRQIFMSIYIMLQEVHTYRTLTTQTVCEFQQVCCVSSNHESWSRESYSACMHANVICVCNVCASVTIYAATTTGVGP